MTTEELMKPRYKVIAGWWDMKPYKVGDIVEAGQHEDLFSPYPHLFKKLEWWEERKGEEMPVYVRYEPTFFEDEKRGTIHKIKVWGKWGDEDKILTGQIYGIVETPNFPNEFSTQTNIAHFQPATEEEFLNQQK